MKRHCFFPALLIATTAFAAGPYDGVYQRGLSPSYTSVHQSGNTLLAIGLDTLPASGISVPTVTGQSIQLASMDFWAYSIGTIAGNVAQMSGTTAFGGCVGSGTVVFDGAGNATSTLMSLTNTPSGASQGLNCAALLQVLISTGANVSQLRKIF